MTPSQASSATDKRDSLTEEAIRIDATVAASSADEAARKAKLAERRDAMPLPRNLQSLLLFGIFLLMFLLEF